MIELVPHDPAWADAFAREAAALTDSLGDLLLSLEHIGSTAVPGLIAKPVIDILAVVADVEALDGRSESFEALGYQVMGEFGIPGRRYFRCQRRLRRVEEGPRCEMCRGHAPVYRRQDNLHSRRGATGRYD